MTEEEKAYHQEQIAVAYVPIKLHQLLGPNTHSSRLRQRKQLLNKLKPASRLRRGLVQQYRHVDHLEALLFDNEFSKSQKSSVQAEVCAQGSKLKHLQDKYNEAITFSKILHTKGCFPKIWRYTIDMKTHHSMNDCAIQNEMVGELVRNVER